ncbi:MAG: L,D-transpeptidase family protein [Bdellovibrionota bacterium]
MFSKSRSSMTFALLAVGFVTSIASTATAASFPGSYSTSFGATNVQRCPALPPDQIRIIKPMPTTNPCLGRGTSLVALSKFHLLYVCENEVAVDNYDIAIGSQGTGKTVEGDRKTPIGVYSLGTPRKSDLFGFFIPIGYPTRAQAARGFTGEAVGIHGPVRDFRCVGFLNVVFDWTAGCVAVADDGYVARIAKWVKAHPKATITIL